VVGAASVRHAPVRAYLAFRQIFPKYYLRYSFLSTFILVLAETSIGLPAPRLRAGDDRPAPYRIPKFDRSAITQSTFFLYFLSRSRQRSGESFGSDHDPGCAPGKASGLKT